MLEGPIYMWNRKTLYQGRVFQPRNWPTHGFSGSKGDASYYTNATYKIILVLDRPLLHSPVGVPPRLPALARRLEFPQRSLVESSASLAA